MTCPRLSFGLVLCLALTACVAEEDTALVTPIEGEAGAFGEAADDVGGDNALPEECDAADYRPLIGTSIAAVTLPADDMIRAYGETDIVTQEYLPQRTNIIYGMDGVILRVTCG